MLGLLKASMSYHVAFHRFGKKLNEKSRECHNHKSQPTPDTKRKRTKTGSNPC